MKKKFLIINADDFGVCPQTNKAIVELYTEKLISSTSLIASGTAFHDAIEQAQKSNIKVGVHFAFNSDYSNHLWQAISDKELVSSLVDADGFFHNDTNLFNKGAISTELDIEMQNQYDIIAKSGVSIDHADSHCGTLYGINGRLFFINAFRFCKKYNLPFRFPKNPEFLQDYFANKVPPMIKIAHKAVVFISKLYGVKLINNMISNPYKLKDIPNYKALEDYYLDKIRNLQPGVTELFLHPSYDAPSLCSNEWKKRIYELEFLHSQNFQTALKDSGAEICSYEIFKSL
jgi:predicted glycoside hydrolase/deacetylase ChbG (UPF0249 family)